MLLFSPAVANPSPLFTFGSHFTLHIALPDSECVATQALRSIDHTLTFPSSELDGAVGRREASDVSERFPSDVNIIPNNIPKNTYPLRRYSPVSFQDNDVIHAACPVRLAACSPEETS